MSEVLPLAFEQTDLSQHIGALDERELDQLEFGVIGFAGDTTVRIFNAFEADASGLSSARVLGQPLFTVVAPCMNNYMVAQRFEDAAAGGTTLDATIHYVLTLRMRPVKVLLRLLAAPHLPMRFVLVARTL